MLFRVELLQSASTLLDSVLKSALFYRQAKANFYDTPMQISERVSQTYIPWTASKGTRGTRNSIIEQVQQNFVT